MTVRVAAVGTGRWGRTLADAVGRGMSLSIVACTSRAADNRAAFAKTYGCRDLPTLDAVLVLLNVPFSLAGGLVALALRGMNLSVSAAVGFISLFGVAVMSGVLYIAEVRRRRLDGHGDLEDAAVQAARSQFRPMLLLIVVAMLGMVPASVARDIGSDIQRPLATVVVGGLASTLVLTLFALPAVYVLAHRARSRGPA